MPTPDDITILLSVRVADAKQWAPHSFQQPCSRCQAAVWVSPASAELLTRGKTSQGFPPTLVCTRCLTIREQLQMATEGVAMTQAQVREIATYLAGRN